MSMTHDTTQLLTDIAGGRCYVVLSDGETHDTIGGCEVRVLTEDEEGDLNWGDTPQGYIQLDMEKVVAHYIKTVLTDTTSGDSKA